MKRHSATRLQRASVGLAAMAMIGLPTAAQAGTVTVPYSDLAATGTITLCDAAGHEVRSGSIYDKPFVWRAISSVPAVAPWRGPKGTAILAAYQPRSTAYPDKWNGDTLTATSRYVDPKHPTAVATGLDFTLSDFLHEFNASWEGWVQLRMFLDAPDNGSLTDSYPTADIKVSGSTWTLERGGGGTCTTDAAVSSEVYESHLNTTPAPSPGASNAPTGSTSLDRVASPGSTPTESGPGSVASSPPGSPGSAHGGSRSGKGWIVALIVVVAGGAGLVILRRRGA